MPSKLRASAAQDMTRWNGGFPGTIMFTMKVNGALLALQHTHSAEAFTIGIKGNLPDHSLTARCRDTYKLPLPSGIEESSPQPCKSGSIH